MYVLIGSQFENITVMRLEIQPDPVSQRHIQSPTCRFSKNLDNLSPTSTPPSRAFKTQTRRKDVYQSITEAAMRKRVFSRGNALYASSKIVQPRVGREKGIGEAFFFIVWSNIQQIHLERVLKRIQTRAIANL